ncbi:hypothetical protein MD484_g5916, partial [Candolleomyces efflorescens]
MGAQGSAHRGDPDAEQGGEAIVDYYRILEVAEDASQDEIKRSFRRLALIHHPDKNHGNVEEATQKFAVIQQAYEVLSDEQERAWYDSHKTSLVPEADGEAVFEDIRSGKPPPRTRDRGLTPRHLARFFDATIWKGYDDSTDSFFTIYRNLFERLASEENMLDNSIKYPSFGYSTWPWSSEMKKRTDADGAAREFYTVWTNFGTEKDFTWVEQWKLSDAPDRRVRRLMEKDNKKVRDDARREYNDTVRSLAKFLRKRDPRFQKHQRELSEIATQNEAQSKAKLADAKARSSAAADSYVEQDWQKIDPSKQHHHADLEWGIAEGGDRDEEWECVACGKSFRSEAAWDSHERSKKHLKAIEKLRKEMEQDDEEFDLQEEPADEEAVDEDEDLESESPPQAEVDGDDGEEEELTEGENPWDCIACGKSFQSQAAWDSHERSKKHRKAFDQFLKEIEREDAQSARQQDAPLKATNGNDTPAQAPEVPASPSLSPAPEEALPGKRKGAKSKSRKQTSTTPAEIDDIEETDGMPLSKTARKALRRAKLEDLHSQAPSPSPAPQTPTPAGDGTEDGGTPEPTSKPSRRKDKASTPQELECNVCQATFTTKTKLFAHVRDKGHASAVPVEKGQKKSKKNLR